VKYFLPDSQDMVDPSFDFETEQRSATRLRQRDDQYAHEVFATRAFDGILVSKGIVDGFGATGSRYTLAQRHRLLRSGVSEFFRLSQSAWAPIPVMGDCGAFTYVNEDMPPYSVADVLRFYLECGFQYGISVDHVILDYNAAWDTSARSAEVPTTHRRRQEITLDLARDFLREVRASGTELVPLGVAQGWSPNSYAASVESLQRIGYDYIALGGMVPLKTRDVLASLAAVQNVRRTDTALHLLGITRVDQLKTFAAHGVASFDSTSPLRQAFKDDKDNYYTIDRQFTAIRIPQVQGNPKLQKAISSGKVRQEDARRLERACLDAMRRFDERTMPVTDVLALLRDYEALTDPGDFRTEVYRETLEERPWAQCRCDICLRLGHHVILFRGAERNRRRGLHNTWVFYRRVQLAAERGIPDLQDLRTNLKQSERATA
jgi:hypothetical protein